MMLSSARRWSASILARTRWNDQTRAVSPRRPTTLVCLSESEGPTKPSLRQMMVVSHNLYGSRLWSFQARLFDIADLHSMFQPVEAVQDTVCMKKDLSPVGTFDEAVVRFGEDFF